jgi:cytochrome c553
LRRRLLFGLTALAGLGFGAAISGAAPAGDAKLLAYGRHLSAECSACHRPEGAAAGIPSITGREIQEFIATIGSYRNGERKNPTMVSVAQSLDDDQIKALATYFATLPKGHGTAAK